MVAFSCCHAVCYSLFRRWSACLVRAAKTYCFHNLDDIIFRCMPYLKLFPNHSNTSHSVFQLCQCGQIILDGTSMYQMKCGMVFVFPLDTLRAYFVQLVACGLMNKNDLRFRHRLSDARHFKK